MGLVDIKIMPFSVKNNVAIVGASKNPEKYGYKVLADLQAAGWSVVPINPKEESILNLKVYPSILQVPEKIDGIVFVTPPVVTEQVLAEVKQLGIKDVWFQPGSANQEAIDFCQANDIHYIKDACIMVQKNNLK